MKRTLALVICVVLFVSMMVPSVSAVIPGEDHACESAGRTYDEAILLAIQAFPEHKDKLSKPEFTESELLRICTETSPTLIVNDTRNLEEGVSVNYAEYSNGISIVSVVDSLLCRCDKYINSSETVDAATWYEVSLTMVAVSDSQSFNVTGIHCALQPGYFSQIFDIGTIYNAGAMAPIVFDKQLVWTAATPAYIEYSAGFTYSLIEAAPILYTVNFLFQVGPNSLVTDAYLYTG